MRWREAVLAAIDRYGLRHATSTFSREELLDEELATMISDTGSTGATPWQTVSRELQEIRDDGLIDFVDRGRYLMLHREVPVDREDLSGSALSRAIRANRLVFDDVPTGDVQVHVRRRRGQERLRKLNLAIYAACCAACDVRDRRLLVASHIVRWADDRGERGNLRNVMCLCRMHDSLFENGYWSLNRNYEVLNLRPSGSKMIEAILSEHTNFVPPQNYMPDPALFERHQQRFQLSTGAS